MHNAVIANVEGPLLIEQSPLPIDVEALLRSDGKEGRYVAFTIKDGEEEAGRACFLVGGDTRKNERARRLLTEITGVHMIMHGTVIFADLPEAAIKTMIEFG